jgi:UPF0716 protein FxsA
MVGRLIFLVFLVVPLIEIALFILIGQAIGLWPTLLGVIAIAIVGSAIIRHQGLSLLAQIRDTMGRGQLPARALADAMLVSIAGILMVTPGYFTDFLGLLLLIPPVRALIYRLVRSRLGLGDAPPGATSYRSERIIELDDTDFRPR